jgi:hypothetical protein
MGIPTGLATQSHCSTSPVSHLGFVLIDRRSCRGGARVDFVNSFHQSVCIEQAVIRCFSAV